MHVHWVLPKGPWCEGGGYMYTGCYQRGRGVREAGTCTLGVTKGATV